jgi:hypothetical protein
LGTGELLGFTLTAALLQRFDLLLVGLGQRNSVAAGEEEVARITSADFDLVTFATETVDGLNEE